MTDDSKYERARARLPGLLEYSKKREMFLAAMAVIAVVYALGSAWRSNGQLAACKAEKQQGWVVVLDGKGDRVDMPVAEADAWLPSNGLIFGQLESTVQCLRGIDPSRKHMKKCWDKAAPLFVGADALKPFDEYKNRRFPSTEAVERALSEEEISVDVGTKSKPDDVAVPGRFWMRWTETHKPRNGREWSETWSGTFDVNLIPMQGVNAPPLQIIRWKWQCDDGPCKTPKVTG